MSKKNWYTPFLRYPRTTQERRANQERNDPYVRGRRRILPTSYDDLFVIKQRSWKCLRDKQYRCKEDKEQYGWHCHYYTYGDYASYSIMRNIVDKALRLGCYYKWGRGGCIKWYGPSFGYELNENE